MKSIKKLMKLVAFALAFGFVFSLCTTVEAAEPERQKETVYVNPTGEWKSITKMRKMVNSDPDNTYFTVYLGDEGDYVSDLKVNKKSGLKPSIIYQTNSYWSEGSWACYTQIGMDISKAGTYKISFKVRKADGTVRASKSMTVYATNTSGVYTKMTLDGKTVYQNTVTAKKGTYTATRKTATYVGNKTKGKLKITANKGYSITGIIVVHTDKNGKKIMRKLKNNRVIQLSQAYASKSYSPSSSSRSAKKYTYVYISYKDKYLKTYKKYATTTARGVKEIKVTEKSVDGKKSTSYSVYSSITFWTY